MDYAIELLIKEKKHLEDALIIEQYEWKCREYRQHIEEIKAALAILTRR